jgi:hypothetical protein
VNNITPISKILNDAGVEIVELHKWDQYLRGTWEFHFAKDLSTIEKKKIHMHQFLWHLFSYKRVECLKNSEAKTAFNDLLKRSCYLFYQDQSQAFLIEDSNKIKAEHFEQENDIYIVDRDFRWTYVQTHEEQCGPYFLLR